tara:strand:- start:21 stop:392 length:372 start_codon:yes stop_codon:yes gene_type:complete
MFTPGGDLLLHMATRKTSGKLYRYYVVNKNQNLSAGTGSMGILSAGKLETAILQQVLDILRSGHMVQQELALDDNVADPGGSRLMQALDSANQRFGRGMVTLASAGLAGELRQWSMKQERRTP